MSPPTNQRTRVWTQLGDLFDQGLINAVRCAPIDHANDVEQQLTQRVTLSVGLPGIPHDVTGDGMSVQGALAGALHNLRLQSAQSAIEMRSRAADHDKVLHGLQAVGIDEDEPPF